MGSVYRKFIIQSHKYCNKIIYSQRKIPAGSCKDVYIIVKLCIYSHFFKTGAKHRKPTQLLNIQLRFQITSHMFHNVTCIYLNKLTFRES